MMPETWDSYSASTRVALRAHSSQYGSTPAYAGLSMGPQPTLGGPKYSLLDKYKRCRVDLHTAFPKSTGTHSIISLYGPSMGTVGCGCMNIHREICIDAQVRGTHKGTQEISELGDVRRVIYYHPNQECIEEPETFIQFSRIKNIPFSLVLQKKHKLKNGMQVKEENYKKQRNSYIETHQ